MSAPGIVHPKTFNERIAPTGYVPGKGRGANGFTTSFDYGNVMKNTEEEEKPETEFSLFGNDDTAKEDAENEAIFDAIDNSLIRRKTKVNPSENSEVLHLKNITLPEPTTIVKDMKRSLESVTENEWYAIEDIGSKSFKYKQEKKKDYFAAVPDSFILSRMNQNQVSNVAMDGDTESGFATTTSTLGSNAKQQSFQKQLSSSYFDSVSGRTAVDPKGYMTSLNSMRIDTESQITDMKKARTMFSSLVNSNPQSDQAWISYARLEETAGKIDQARKLIRKGCEYCPKSEAVWREAIRLQTDENKKIVALDAIKHIPTSVNLWLDTSKLETIQSKKIRVLLKALESIPNSVTLWKAAVEMESPENARILLHRAVESIPTNVDLWLALAKLETYSEAKKVLNQARKAIPTNPIIWFTAAQLEEANGTVENVDKTIKRCLESIQANSVQISHKQWIEYAQTMESAGSIHTCNAIIHYVLPVGVEPIDRRSTWKADAETSLDNGFIATARAIYAFCLNVFPKDEELWVAAILLEQKSDNTTAMCDLLKIAVKNCSDSEALWLLSTQAYYRKIKDIDMARKILQESFEVNKENTEFSSSEKIWLAAYQIEYETKNYDRARGVLSRARAACKSQRVWLKSALLEWELNNYTEEESILNQAIQLFPLYDKYYMMLGQMKEELHLDKEACIAYRKGLQLCQSSVYLWHLYVNLEKRITSVAKARSLLEMARVVNPTSAFIWLDSIALEKEEHNEKLITKLIADSLNALPDDGRLLCEQIINTPRPQRPKMISESIKQHSSDPYLFMLAARYFWSEKNNTKAIRWFEQSLAQNSDIGEHWAYYYLFKLETDTKENIEVFLTRFDSQVPIHGDLWCSIKKAKENKNKTPREWLALTVEQIKQTAKF